MWALCGHSFLNWIPIFECYMARFIIKNGHRKVDDEIGLCAQNISTIVGSIVNIFGKAYATT